MRRAVKKGETKPFKILERFFQLLLAHDQAAHKLEALLDSGIAEDLIKEATLDSFTQAARNRIRNAIGCIEFCPDYQVEVNYGIDIEAMCDRRVLDSKSFFHRLNPCTSKLRGVHEFTLVVCFFEQKKMSLAEIHRQLRERRLAPARVEHLIRVARKLGKFPFNQILASGKNLNRGSHRRGGAVYPALTFVDRPGKKPRLTLVRRSRTVIRPEIDAFLAYRK